MEQKKIALAGMGACGTVYARGLSKTFGNNFRVIAAGERKTRLAQGVCLNGEPFFPTLAADGFQADLLIFSTKNYDLEKAVQDALPFIHKDTVVLPTLNGITAKAVIQKALPNNTVLYGMDTGIDALRTSEGVTMTKPPMLVFGEEWNPAPSDTVLWVQEVLTQAGIPCRIGKDMKQEVWRKWMWNIGFNQVTAALDATYGDVASIPEIYALAEGAMFEVYALARRLDIPLSTDDILVKRHAYDHAAPFGKTSMAQDVEHHRKTEVDSFAGMLLSLCEKADLQAPVNQTLYYIIKAKEQQYGIKEG